MTLMAEETANRAAVTTAAAICDAFARYHDEFQVITRKAKEYFERREWAQLHHDAQVRLELHGNYVNDSVTRLKSELGDRATSTPFWKSVKEEYSRLISERGDFEVAETFYNSVAMRVASTIGIDAECHFVGGEVHAPPTVAQSNVFKIYSRNGSTAGLIEHVLEDYRFACDYKHLRESAAAAAGEIESYLQQIGWSAPIETLEVASPVFYRGQLAFVVGRICNHSGYVPLVLALSNTDEGVMVDAVLMAEDEVSILFSFTRWYFFVEVQKPQALVGFLRSILPRKPVAELYISIGYNKHGKTELYRDLMRHLEKSTDKFQTAPGARGMVMVVFTLPSYDVVFKMIKDRFDYPKVTDKQDVRNRYYLVFRHDRGGRLVDAQEFQNLYLKKDRFEPSLLEELLRDAPSTISVEGDEVLINHLYIERKLVPLNLFINQAPEEEAAEAVTDLGQAIKDLAATNIFPGDILLKNFGVTRHGRVVFYDYDELCLLTDCNFREIPESDDFDEEMSAEPWYSVGEQDVFPEELHNFLALPPHLKEVFTRSHGEVFNMEFWSDLKERYSRGEVIDVIPYKEQKRLPQPAKESANASPEQPVNSPTTN